MFDFTVNSPPEHPNSRYTDGEPDVVNNVPFLYQDQGEVPPETDALTPPEGPGLFGAVRVITVPTETDLVTVATEQPEPGLEIVAVTVALPLKLPFLVKVLEFPAPVGNVTALEGRIDQFTTAPPNTDKLYVLLVQIEALPDIIGRVQT